MLPPIDATENFGDKEEPDAAHMAPDTSELARRIGDHDDTVICERHADRGTHGERPVDGGGDDEDGRAVLHVAGL